MPWAELMEQTSRQGGRSAAYLYLGVQGDSSREQANTKGATMSKKWLVLANLPIFIAILSLTGLSYGAPGQIASSPLDEAGVVMDRTDDQEPLQSRMAGLTLPAGAQFASAAKPGLFEDQRGSVGSQSQTKEWEARTLRTLGLAELAVGMGTATVGILVMSDSFGAGIVPALVGIAVTYLGYTDLSASRRFFYPDSLLSEDSMKKELLSGTDSDPRNKSNLVFAMQMKF